jgi:hypothetical protein
MYRHRLDTLIVDQCVRFIRVRPDQPPCPLADTDMVLLMIATPLYIEYTSPPPAID